jgi:lipopolysaccharide/colanic/teichoic acid biosynthesis glycosyltransferase
VFFTSLLWKSIGGQKILFLGSSPAMREITAQLEERPELGLSPIGYLGDEESVSGNPPRLGSIRDLDEVLAEQQPARISIGAETERLEHLPVERLMELRLAGIQIEEVSVTYEMIFRRVSTRDLPPVQLIFSNDLRPRAGSVALQTGYSVLLALIGIMITSPLMAVLAFVTKIDRQRCAGLNRAPFDLLRFRCSRQSWLHKMRLDKLPQLINVVRGEMSIVGPRPERLEYISVLEEEIPYYRQRLSVKPGMTGWAQINESEEPRAEDSIAKLEFDRYYIKHLSMALDLYIMLNAFRSTVGLGPR